MPARENAPRPDLQLRNSGFSYGAADSLVRAFNPKVQTLHFADKAVRDSIFKLVRSNTGLRFPRIASRILCQIEKLQFAFHGPERPESAAVNRAGPQRINRREVLRSRIAFVFSKA